MKYYSGFINVLLIGFILLAIFSCKNEENVHLNYGEYRLEKDTCRSIEILDENKLIFKRKCGSVDINKVTKRLTMGGEMLDLYCNDLTYIVDSTDVNQGLYLSAFDRNNDKCYGFHIVVHNSFLVVTPLKLGIDINDHFTQPLIFQSTDSSGEIEFDKRLKIQFSQELETGRHYIAFGQAEIQNSESNEKENTLVRIQNKTNYNKTDLVIDPSYYAFQKYQIWELNSLTNELVMIPIVYHRDFERYQKMTELEKIQFYKEKDIELKFIVLYRFNPGRKRVINKIYNENIIGQTQAFEVINVLSNN